MTIPEAVPGKHDAPQAIRRTDRARRHDVLALYHLMSNESPSELSSVLGTDPRGAVDYGQIYVTLFHFVFGPKQQDLWPEKGRYVTPDELAPPEDSAAYPLDGTLPNFSDIPGSTGASDAPRGGPNQTNAKPGNLMKEEPLDALNGRIQALPLLLPVMDIAIAMPGGSSEGKKLPEATTLTFDALTGHGLSSYSDAYLRAGNSVGFQKFRKEVRKVSPEAPPATALTMFLAHPVMRTHIRRLWLQGANVPVFEHDVLQRFLAQLGAPSKAVPGELPAPCAYDPAWLPPEAHLSRALEEEFYRQQIPLVYLELARLEDQGLAQSLADEPKRVWLALHALVAMTSLYGDLRVLMGASPYAPVLFRGLMNLQIMPPPFREIYAPSPNRLASIFPCHPCSTATAELEAKTRSPVGLGGVLASAHTIDFGVESARLANQRRHGVEWAAERSIMDLEQHWVSGLSEHMRQLPFVQRRLFLPALYLERSILSASMEGRARLWAEIISDGDASEPALDVFSEALGALPSIATKGNREKIDATQRYLETARDHLLPMLQEVCKGRAVFMAHLDKMLAQTGDGERFRLSAVMGEAGGVLFSGTTPEVPVPANDGKSGETDGEATCRDPDFTGFYIYYGGDEAENSVIDVHTLSTGSLLGILSISPHLASALASLKAVIVDIVRSAEAHRSGLREASAKLSEATEDFDTLEEMMAKLERLRGSYTQWAELKVRDIEASLDELRVLSVDELAYVPTSDLVSIVEARFQRPAVDVDRDDAEREIAAVRDELSRMQEAIASREQESARLAEERNQAFEETSRLSGSLEEEQALRSTLSSSLESCQAERDALKFHLDQAGTSRDTPDMAVSLIDAAELLGFLQHERPAEALRLVAKSYPDRVTVLESAIASANAAPDLDGGRLLRCLLAFAVDAWPIMKQGSPLYAIRQVIPGELAMNESDTCMKDENFRGEREFAERLDDGTTRTWLMAPHVSLDYNHRLHFVWDPERQRFVIGHAGIHLPIPSISKG